MVFDIVEQQCRAETARYLARNRADLFVPIDFGVDPS
jgi:hypothetical protein